MSCAACLKNFKKSHVRLCCPGCDSAFHLKCMSAEFESIKTCQFCQLQASLHDSKLKEAIKLCGFKIIHQNIQSLKRKIDELRLFIQELESDIHLLALTETWAKIDMLDVEFNLPGSELFRPDRGF